MKILEIKALENGAHRNQTWNSHDYDIPEGYALVPNDMVTPNNLSFVNIEVAEETRYKEIPRYNEKTEEMETERIPYTVMVVTSITEGVVPEPVPEPIPEPTTDDILNALLGVNENE